MMPRPRTSNCSRCAAGRSASAISTSRKPAASSTPVYGDQVRTVRERHLARAVARLQRLRGRRQDDFARSPPHKALQAEDACRGSASRSSQRRVRPRIDRACGRIWRASASSAHSLVAALRASDRAGRPDRRLRRAEGCDTPIPISRNFVPSTSLASSSRPQSKMRRASCVGSPSERARVRIWKSAVFSFSVTVVPLTSLRLEPRRNALAQVPQDFFQRAKRGDVRVEGGFRGNALGIAVRHHLAVVDTAREAAQPLAFGAEAPHQLAFRRASADRRWCESRRARAAPAPPCRRRR